MDHTLSRSEKKRRAKNVESLAKELIDLSASVIAKLPCDDFIKQEIKSAKSQKAGARKRQTKYITKQLRGIDTEQLLTFMEEQKGSKLKQNKSFHELERLRDDILTEAIETQREMEHLGKPFDSSLHSNMIETAISHYPNLDRKVIKLAAIKYAKTRKPAFSREIFRILKAAFEQKQFQNTEL